MPDLLYTISFLIYIASAELRSGAVLCTASGAAQTDVPANDHLVIHAIPLAMPRAPSLIIPLRHNLFHQAPQLGRAVQKHLASIGKRLGERQEQVRGGGRIRRVLG